jgi:hypothetical protein
LIDVATGDSGQGESLTGLAKRWLKTQFRFHGDPIKSRRDRQEANELETRMHDKVQEDVGRAVFDAVMPESWKQKISDLERHAEERKAEEARRRRAEHEARPRAESRLSFSGDLTGQIETALPTVVTRPETADEALTVELSPLDPIPAGTRSFRGVQFAIPGYSGPGTYDLSALYARNGDDWDPFWFQLWLESDDEPFYWVPDYGPASIVVDTDGRTLRLRMPMQDAGGTHLDVEGVVVLP